MTGSELSLAMKQLRWEGTAARSAATFAERYANDCCRHTEAVSECPHCNLRFLADFARRASAAIEALNPLQRSAPPPSTGAVDPHVGETPA